MIIQLLGSPTVRLPDNSIPTFTTAKSEGLFYYLAATKRPHARATLATLFWGEMEETKARVNLSKALSDVRDQVGSYVTIATREVAFNSSLPYQLDVEPFFTTSAIQNKAISADAIQSLVDQYRGDFLDGFHVRNAPGFEHWLASERERLRTSTAHLLCELAERYQQSGNRTHAISTLRRLLTLEPWREDAHYQLMQLFLHNGEAQAALRQYDLCRLALADELDVEPGEEIKALYARIRTGIRNGNRNAEGNEERSILLSQDDRVEANEFEQSARLQDNLHRKLAPNLPNASTRFVGRESEIEQLAERLQASDCHLLTLIGPGGIGKTRLAVEVARKLSDPQQAGYFPDGIFFVNLMPVESAAGVVSTIAEALGFTFYNNTPPQQQLFNYLKKRKLLLILDNFEQLSAESVLVSELLVAAPLVKILVTSRQALPLQSANFHAVQGLSFSSDSLTALNGHGSTDAARLFYQSAQRHRSTFVLSQEVEQVSAICRLVGGMPLALELAASWLKSLTCAQIVRQLEKGMELLHTNLLDVPERHRDMQVVFEQSWQQLTPQEAEVMARVSIFRGGFSLIAAEEVADATVYTLAALVEKALIRLDEAGRYQIHELLRQFAYEKLAENSEKLQATASAHANFFLNLAARLKSSLEDKRQQAALATLQSDIDNLRIAWLWAMQQSTLPGIVEALDSLFAFFFYTSRYHEGKELFATNADLRNLSSGRILSPSTFVITTHLATRFAVFAFQLGEYQQPSQHFQALLLALPKDELQRDIAIAHMILGQIAGWQGNHAESVDHLQKSVTLFQRLGDQSSVAQVLYRMSEMYEHAWDYQQAIDCAQACLAIGVQLARPDLIANAHLTLGSAHKGLGQPNRSLEHYQQGCVYSEKAGDRLAYGLAVGGVGAITCQCHNEQWAQGFALLQQSLVICREIGHFVHVTTRLILMGLACIDGKRFAEAVPFGEECVELATAANFYKAADFGLRILATSCYEMGDFAMSRLHLRKAISKAIECNYHGLAHDVIVYGLLLEREASQLTEKASNQIRMDAVTLTIAALRRPAWHEYHKMAEHLLDRQKVHLSADQFATAQSRADQYTLEELATHILALEPVQNYRLER